MEQVLEYIRNKNTSGEETRCTHKSVMTLRVSPRSWYVLASPKRHTRTARGDPTKDLTGVPPPDRYMQLRKREPRGRPPTQEEIANWEHKATGKGKAPEQVNRGNKDASRIARNNSYPPNNCRQETALSTMQSRYMWRSRGNDTDRANAFSAKAHSGDPPLSTGNGYHQLKRSIKGGHSL